MYLIDSSAKNLSGHNLEYLKRISEKTKSEFLILGRKDLISDVNPKYRPTFEFGTWDFGRFGFSVKYREESLGQNAKTLKPTLRFIITEKYLEKIAAVLAKKLQGLILLIVSLSKQSRCYRRDLRNGLKGMKLESTILISTANARELIGLSGWIAESDPNRYSISVILRRPIVDLRSFIELPLIFVDALLYISVIQKLANKVKFFADTPGLAARISERSGKEIGCVAAMGFEKQNEKLDSLLDVAVAPNSRIETRYELNGLHNIPDLSSQMKINLDSNKYRELLSRTRSVVLPYDPLRYRSRSSGVFAEALTLGILPVVPTGTSMSRELTNLNSKILPTPKFVTELAFGEAIDIGQFGQEELLVTVKSNFKCSLILEILDGGIRITRSAHDFFESNAVDSFLIRPTNNTILSLKSDRSFIHHRDKFGIAFTQLNETLFGIPYLPGDLPLALSLLKTTIFHSADHSKIKEHSPSSICQSLGI
ncbi:MAG: hypothetical protein F2559_01615 [Actinobacteria bacterium]|nr:hypothetical protein [Actinomycetota bacterium]